MNRNGSLTIIDDRGREVARYQIVYGAHIQVEDGARVTQDQLLATWDPFTFAILTEVAGHVKFQDLKEGVTFDEEVDEVTGQSRMVVKDSPDEKKQPRLEIRNASNKVLKTYQMPVRANLMVNDGDEVEPGDIIAKIPRETTKTKDITGGLPRVVELFEARRPAETAVMSEIDGIVKLGPISKGKRKLIITGDDGEEREYDIPRGTHINVQEGDRVRAGEALMDGPLNPHDILRVLGMNRLQEYLVNEIQEVYRLQGVNINDKHIEVIVRQMLRWVKIKEVGDTDFLLEEQVDRFRFTDENERVQTRRRRSRPGRTAAARYHQGVALDRLVHLGGIVPGDDPRADRGGDLRPHRLPARLEGERHHGTADSCRHRHGVLPQRGHRTRRDDRRIRA